MKFTYWKSEAYGASDCYSIRAKTKKLCAALAAEANSEEEWQTHYGPPTKVVIKYYSTMELVQILRSEDAANY